MNQPTRTVWCPGCRRPVSWPRFRAQDVVGLPLPGALCNRCVNWRRRQAAARKPRVWPTWATARERTEVSA